MNAVAEVEHGLTPAQVATRSTGVGASEVFDALFNPAQLWLRKTGREPFDEGPLLRLGNAIEPYILNEYRLATGNRVRAKPDTLRRGRMIAHLDAIADSINDADEQIAVECKWRGTRDGWGEAHSADIPLPVMLQVQQQMGLAVLRFAHVPVLFMRPPIVTFAIDFDGSLFQLLEEGVGRFWRWVESDTPPDIDPDRPEALEVIRKVYPGTDGRVIQAAADLERWRAVMEQSSERAKNYAQVADTAKAHLLLEMGTASSLRFADGKELRRSIVKRKGYSVEPCEYIDARIAKPKD